MLSNSPTKQPSSVPLTTSMSNLPIATQTFNEFLRSSGSTQRRPRSEPDTLSLHYSLSSSPTSSYNHHQAPLVPVLRSPSISVKAKDFGKHLVEQFSELYTRTDLTDVSIVCGRNHDILRAHQFVIPCSSLYFRDALKIAPCKHPTVVVRGLPGHDMGRILEYIYLGQVTLKSESELNQFVKAAKYLQVVGIQQGKYILSR